MVSNSNINNVKTKTIGEIFSKDPKIICRNVDVFYGEKQAIKDLSLIHI